MTMIANNPDAQQGGGAILSAPALAGRFTGPGVQFDPEAGAGGEASQAGRLCASLPPLPRGVEWLTVAQAAERKCVKERAIQVKCLAWAAEGKAVPVAREEGGMPRWMIRSDADPALAVIPLAADIPVDIRRLSDSQAEQLGEKAAILAEWDAACRAANRACVPNAQRLTREDVTRLFIERIKRERGIVLSERTLREWYRRSRGKGGGNGLIDGRWRRDRKTHDDDPFMQCCKKLYLSKEGLSVRYCRKLAMLEAQREGWTVWGYRKVAKFIESIPLTERMAARGTDKAYTDEAESFIERDWEPVKSNEQWGSDHHKLDLWVRVETGVDTQTGEVKFKNVRPWLTLWMDNASRKILAWEIYDGDPCTDRIITTFRAACLAHGLPESVWVDNGKDYDSFALHGRTKRQRRGINRELIYGLFTQAQVKAHNVQPYHGQSKPVERFFRTMENQFCRLFPDAYCGNSPSARPDDLQERLDAGKAPTLAEVKAAFGAWVEGIYNAGEHTGEANKGASPNAVYAAKLGVKRLASDAIMALLLLKHSRPVLVTQNGVRFNGFRYGNVNPALKRLLRKKVVLLYDPAAPARVQVYTESGDFVCVADSNQRLPANATADQMQAAMKAKRHARKAERAHKQTRHHLHERPIDIMRELAAQQRKAEQQQNDPPPPPHVKLVRSRFEDQMPQVQKALKMPALRPAAGAENVDLIAWANANLDIEGPRGSGLPKIDLFKDDAATDGSDGGSPCP